MSGSARLPCLLLSLGICAYGPAQEKPPAGADAAAVLTAMTDPRLPYDDLLELEARLKAMPVTEVLPVLVQSPHRVMPEGGIYNGGTPEIEKDFPLQWKLFYSLGRVESHLRRNAPIDELQRALMAVDPKCDIHEARIRVYWDCWLRTTEGMVDSARIVFEDEDRSLATRLLAARTLLQFDKNNSYEIVLEFAIDNDVLAPLVREFARLYPGRKEHDPRLVDHVFAAVEKARAAQPSYPYAAYFLAQEAGRLVGQEFYPYRKDPKFAAASRDELAVATVDAALAWWRTWKAEHGR